MLPKKIYITARKTTGTTLRRSGYLIQSQSITEVPQEDIPKFVKDLGNTVYICSPNEKGMRIDLGMTRQVCRTLFERGVTQGSCSPLVAETANHKPGSDWYRSAFIGPTIICEMPEAEATLDTTKVKDVKGVTKTTVQECGNCTLAEVYEAGRDAESFQALSKPQQKLISQAINEFIED